MEEKTRKNKGKFINIRKEIRILMNPKKAKVLQRFFKTGKGEYGEGDVFYGITVPDSRKIAEKYSFLNFPDIQKLLKSKIHEERLIALLILVRRFKFYPESRKNIFDFYMKNIKFIDNWDLVDLSADKIIGAYLFNKPKRVLYKLAKSRSIWEKRISMVSTFNFIKNGEFKNTFKISNILLKDNHDLIQKAVGWMLREVGKRNMEIEEKFLKTRYKNMPRTMLRYAIEKFPEKKRRAYLEGKIK